MFCIVPWSASPVRKSPVADWVVRVAEADTGTGATGGEGAGGAGATSGTAGAAGCAGGGATTGTADVDEEVAGVAKVGLG